MCIVSENVDIGNILRRVLQQRQDDVVMGLSRRALLLLFKGQFDAIKSPLDFLLLGIWEFPWTEWSHCKEKIIFNEKLIVDTKRFRMSIMVRVLFVASVFRFPREIATFVLLPHLILELLAVLTQGWKRYLWSRIYWQQYLRDTRLTWPASIIWWRWPPGTWAGGSGGTWWISASSFQVAEWGQCETW